MDLFLHFNDIIIDDFTKMVEESMVLGRVSGAINWTIIDLIQKIVKSDSFSYYCPISLQNMIKKLISKTISIEIKPILSKFISSEQFCFLEHR